MMMAVIIGGIVGFIAGTIFGIFVYVVVLNSVLNPAEKDELLKKIRNYGDKEL